MSYNNRILTGQRALLLNQTFSMLGFSVLYSTLILYTTQGLQLDSSYALAITGSFIALNYALHVLGGYIGGKLLSYRGLFIIGMVLQTIGALIITIGNFEPMIWGVSVFLAGCGLNMICINCMLTQLFDPHDKNRESAFLWNYSGMNLGFLIGFLVSGFFQLEQMFHPLFVFASLGSLVSFCITLANWKVLGDTNTQYINSKEKGKRSLIAALIIVGVIGLLPFLLRHATISNNLIAVAGVFVALCFIYFSWKEKTKNSAKKIRAFLILAFGGTVFWSLYQMTPLGITLFFERNVEHYIFGFRIPPQWLPMINSFVIILGGPAMAAMNQRLRQKGYRISLPFQFTTALILIGVGFLLMDIGINFANIHGYSSIYWVIGYYICQSFGELFISPIGYAMIGQLIPQRLQAFAMGAWLMITGIGAVLSTYFSQAALGTFGNQSALATNSRYSSVFFELGLIGVGTGIMFFFARKFLHKLIQEKRTPKSDEPAPYHSSHE